MGSRGVGQTMARPFREDQLDGRTLRGGGSSGFRGAGTVVSGYPPDLSPASLDLKTDPVAGTVAVA